MRKLVAILSAVLLALVLSLPVLAETREVSQTDTEVAEVEEVVLLKATPSEATPSEAEPEQYAYLYGMKVTHEYVTWMYPELTYPHRYCVFHDNPNDIWYVCDLETGRIYADGFFGDEATGYGLRFDHEGTRNLPTLIKKAPTVWCERNWPVLCLTRWGYED